MSRPPGWQAAQSRAACSTNRQSSAEGISGGPSGVRTRQVIDLVGHGRSRCMELRSMTSRRAGAIALNRVCARTSRKILVALVFKFI